MEILDNIPILGTIFVTLIVLVVGVALFYPVAFIAGKVLKMPVYAKIRNHAVTVEILDVFDLLRGKGKR